jgi:hypothetical protein
MHWKFAETIEKNATIVEQLKTAMKFGELVKKIILANTQPIST